MPIDIYLGVGNGEIGYSVIGRQPIYQIFPENLPTAHKWNLMAENALQNSSAKLFMLGADDMIFETPGWDKALIDHYNALENKIHVYALRDSRDTDGTPHIIVSRDYILAMGYFVPPLFLHWFIDSWTVEIAKANNCFTHLRDFKLTHDKPSDRGQPDETHSRIREWGWHERDKWVAEKMAHVLEGEKKRLGGFIGVFANCGPHSQGVIEYDNGYIFWTDVIKDRDGEFLVHWEHGLSIAHDKDGKYIPYGASKDWNPGGIKKFTHCTWEDRPKDMPTERKP